MLRHPLLTQQIDAWFCQEITQLSKSVLWVPLGQTVAEVLKAVAASKNLNLHILDGLPHPSPANVERVNYFLEKPPRPTGWSRQVKQEKLDAARRSALATVHRLTAP